MGQLVFQATAGGQVALVGPNPTSNFSLNVPAVNGNLVTTGDTGTVTNTMLASSAYTAPGTIGSGTPNSGAFTTLSASSTVSGTGFSTYLASPPAIGGTTPSTGKFTSITNTGLTATQVIYATTGGLETSSANMTFNGTSLTLANDASISGLTVGKGGGSVSTNTALGASALSSNTTGASNTAIGNLAGTTATTINGLTAIGWGAGQTINNAGTDNYGSSFLGARTGTGVSSGIDNTFIGAYSGRNTTTGSTNVGLGAASLYSNTTASNNTAVGYQSMYTNTTGGGQAFGYQALYSQTTGTNNSAFGYQALYLNTTGYQNIAMGDNALNSNTSGINNVGLGVGSLRNNTTASNNTAVGYQAGYANTTGASNAFFGMQAGYTTSVSTYNTFLGYQAGQTHNLGSAGNGVNTYVGAFAGQNATTGTYNSFLGSVAGNLMTSGSKNTIVGAYSGNQGGLDIRTSSNYIVLSDGDGNPRLVGNSSGQFIMGATATLANERLYLYGDSTAGHPALICDKQAAGATGCNQILFNNNNGFVGSITTSGSLTSFNVSSDRRLKENIAPLTGGLSSVLALKPSQYNYIADPSTQIQGFIADELQAVVPHAVFGEKDAVDAEGKPVYQGVDASFLIPHLVAAIQELNAKVTALKAKLGA